ncbi:MAG: MliC family protein [Zoogloeaceae bacterium]|nr:MliC family protein [Zoogloeaceae bacterium]
MPRASTLAALTALTLAACASPPPTPPSAGVVDVPGSASPQLSFQLASGTYRCEYGAQVDVQRDARDPNLITVVWRGGRHLMVRNPSSSGLPRFENADSGMVWIDLPWKSVLLDGKSGKPLVSECRGAGTAAAHG